MRKEATCRRRQLSAAFIGGTINQGRRSTARQRGCKEIALCLLVDSVEEKRCAIRRPTGRIVLPTRTRNLRSLRAAVEQFPVNSVLVSKYNLMFVTSEDGERER